MSDDGRLFAFLGLLAVSGAVAARGSRGVVRKSSTKSSKKVPKKPKVIGRCEFAGFGAEVLEVDGTRVRINSYSPGSGTATHWVDAVELSKCRPPIAGSRSTMDDDDLGEGEVVRVVPPESEFTVKTKYNPGRAKPWRVHIVQSSPISVGMTLNYKDCATEQEAAKAAFAFAQSYRGAIIETFAKKKKR